MVCEYLLLTSEWHGISHILFNATAISASWLSSLVLYTLRSLTHKNVTCFSSAWLCCPLVVVFFNFCQCKVCEELRPEMVNALHWHLRQRNVHLAGFPVSSLNCATRLPWVVVKSPGLKSISLSSPQWLVRFHRHKPGHIKKGDCVKSLWVEVQFIKEVSESSPSQTANVQNTVGAKLWFLVLV